MTAPSEPVEPVKCPTCGRAPSMRVGVEVVLVTPAPEQGCVSIPGEPQFEVRYPTEPCPDQIHDRADQCARVPPAAPPPSTRYAVRSVKESDGFGEVELWALFDDGMAAREVARVGSREEAEEVARLLNAVPEQPVELAHAALVEALREIAKAAPTEIGARTHEWHSGYEEGWFEAGQIARTALTLSGAEGTKGNNDGQRS